MTKRRFEYTAIFRDRKRDILIITVYRIFQTQWKGKFYYVNVKLFQPKQICEGLLLMINIRTNIYMYIY